jgi:trigger factor
MKLGSKKTFKIKFPKDYSAQDLQDQEAQFDVELKGIKARKLPEVTEEFAKEAGYESLKDMNEKAKSGLLKQRAQEAERAVKEELVNKLIEKNPFDVPLSMVQNQTEHVARDYMTRLQQMYQLPEEELRNAAPSQLPIFEKQAERQVRAGLIFDAFSKKEGIEVTDADVELEVQKIHTETKFDIERIRSSYATGKARENLMGRIKEDRVVAALIEKNSK